MSKTFFQILVYIDVLNFHKLALSRSLQHYSKCPSSPCMHVARFTSPHTSTARVPIHFRYQRRHLLTDAFLLVYPCDTPLTSCNPTERNLNISKRTNPPFRIFQSILLHNSHSKFRYSCVKIWRYPVASHPH